MRKTFIELSVQYKQLTDAEKQTPFGQALSSSLDQLKGRIQDSKSQIDSAKNALGQKDKMMIWEEHDLMDPRTVSRRTMRDKVSDFMRTVMNEVPVDETLVDFADDTAM